jgi:hypothetical protein
MDKLIQKRVVDGLIEAYVSWREACLRVTDAYRSWTSETGLGAASAFGCYMAALDQEQRAAEVYAGLVQRAGKFASGGHDPSGAAGGLYELRESPGSGDA